MSTVTIKRRAGDTELMQEVPGQRPMLHSIPRGGEIDVDESVGVLLIARNPKEWEAVGWTPPGESDLARVLEDDPAHVESVERNEREAAARLAERARRGKVENQGQGPSSPGPVTPPSADLED